MCRYAWYKLFNLAKSYNKNLGAADVQMMASRRAFTQDIDRVFAAFLCMYVLCCVMFAV